MGRGVFYDSMDNSAKKPASKNRPFCEEDISLRIIYMRQSRFSSTRPTLRLLVFRCCVFPGNLAKDQRLDKAIAAHIGCSTARREPFGATTCRVKTFDDAFIGAQHMAGNIGCHTALRVTNLAGYFHRIIGTIEVFRKMRAIELVLAFIMPS